MVNDLWKFFYVKYLFKSLVQFFFSLCVVFSIEYKHTHIKTCICTPLHEGQVLSCLSFVNIIYSFTMCLDFILLNLCFEEQNY